MKIYKLVICLLFFTAIVSAQELELISNPEVVNISSKNLNEMTQQPNKFVDKGRIVGIQTAILRMEKLSPYKLHKPFEQLGLRNTYKTLVNNSLIENAGINNQDIVKPILLDKSALSGVGLKKLDLKDEPEKDFYQKRLYWGEDLGVFVVGTETWNNKVNNYSFDEFIYMYNGEAIVKPRIGSSQVFYSGDYFFAPKGFSGEWEIRAGDYLHYELSVITTKRVDSSLVKENSQHQHFSKSKLSGNNIHLDSDGNYEEILQQGAELTIKLRGEAPLEKGLDVSGNEQLIHLLSGLVKIIDTQGKEHQFYSGDFFILPKGIKGKWKSEGHQLVKFLIIEKTKRNKVN